MKKLIIIFMTALVCAVPAIAQKGLAINALFGDRYRTDPDAVVTSISGDMLHSRDVSKYRSIAITGRPAEADAIEKALNADSSLAVENESSYRGGRLYYAFLSLPPYDGENRYVLYINQHAAGGDKILLVYIQGSLSSRKVKEMIRKQDNP